MPEDKIVYRWRTNTGSTSVSFPDKRGYVYGCLNPVTWASPEHSLYVIIIPENFVHKVLVVNPELEGTIEDPDTEWLKTAIPLDEYKGEFGDFNTVLIPFPVFMIKASGKEQKDALIKHFGEDAPEIKGKI